MANEGYEVMLFQEQQTSTNRILTPVYFNDDGIELLDEDDTSEELVFALNTPIRLLFLYLREAL